MSNFVNSFWIRFFFLSINNDEIVCNKTFVRVQQILKKIIHFEEKLNTSWCNISLIHFFFIVMFCILFWHLIVKNTIIKDFFSLFFRCYFLGYFWMSFVVVRLECIYYMNESNQIKSNQIQSHESTTQKLNDDAWFFFWKKRENDFVCFFFVQGFQIWFYFGIG